VKELPVLEDGGISFLRNVGNDRLKRRPENFELHPNAMKISRLEIASFFKVWEGKTSMERPQIKIVSQRDKKLKMKRSEGRWNYRI